MFRIPYGESNLEFIRNKKFLYVDKTHFLERLESTGKLIQLRPRRFGKSLFISMLESYYDIATVNKFDQLFEGLHVRIMHHFLSFHLKLFQSHPIHFEIGRAHV